MQEAVHKLTNFLNYLFPEKTYEGKKITDKRWIRAFIPFAPFVAFALCLIILILGITTSRPKPYGLLLSPHWIAFIVAVLWTSVFLSLAKSTKKKGRSPALFLLLANFFPLKILLGVTLFVGMHTSMKKKFDEETRSLSQIVQQHHEENQRLVQEKREKMEKDFNERYQLFKTYLSNKKKPVDESAEKFDFSKETDRMMRETIEQNQKEFQEMKKRAMESLEKQPSGTKIREKYKKLFLEGLGRGPANKTPLNPETSSAENNAKETANLTPPDSNEHPENNH